MQASHESADFVAVDETRGCDAYSRSNDSRYLLIHFLHNIDKKPYLDILSRSPNKTSFTRNSCHSMIHLFLLIVHPSIMNDRSNTHSYVTLKIDRFQKTSIYIRICFLMFLFFQMCGSIKKNLFKPKQKIKKQKHTFRKN